MSRDKYGHNPCGHEGHGGDKGAHREPREPAYAVTGHTAVAPYRTETNKDSGESQNGGICLDSLGGQSSGHDKHNNRRHDESGDKGKPPGEFAIRVGWKQADRHTAA